MEFMGISVGVLALVCALILLFGAQGARKILAWTSAAVVLGAVGVGVVVWAWPLVRPSPPAESDKSSATYAPGPDGWWCEFVAGADSEQIKKCKEDARR